MTIEAKIIEDSVGPGTRRLTTFQLTYPRFIHAEFMTHRQFSRNASSSRAIPVEKQIAMIKADTAMPVHWGMNQSGMQAEQESDAKLLLGKSCKGYDRVEREFSAQEAWEEARDRAIEVAEAFVEAGYHKQVVNRILEPFSHISVIVTSSQYDNFFALRSHKDAQPEIKVLSDLMLEAYNTSTPRLLNIGDWHMPYITEEERAYVDSAENVQHSDVPLTIEDLVKMSGARCARVSYLTHDGKKPSQENDMKLYDRLVGSVPLHASPVEHQATPDTKIWNAAELPEWEKPWLHGNLSGGWIQYRKMLPNECYDAWEDPQDPFK